tara:strand:- start:16642 stop:16833 length:192 start_codon:yes stop_codon:yes gene_type:complete
MPVDKKPVDILLEYVVQLKILIEEQQKTINDLKKDMTKMRASISVLNDNIKEQNDISKKGWIF